MKRPRRAARLPRGLLIAAALLLPAAVFGWHRVFKLVHRAQARDLESAAGCPDAQQGLPRCTGLAALPPGTAQYAWALREGCPPQLTLRGCSLLACLLAAVQQG